MTEVERLLAGLVSRGCLLRCPGGLHHVAAARIKGNRLTWATMFAVDQSYVHSEPFDRAEVVIGRSQVMTYRGDNVVVHVALYDDWPDIDAAAYAAERDRWLAWLADPDNRQSFERFYEAEAANLESDPRPGVG